jgi:hypothetical protein
MLHVQRPPLAPGVDAGPLPAYAAGRAFVSMQIARCASAGDVFAALLRRRRHARAPAAHVARRWGRNAARYGV